MKTLIFLLFGIGDSLRDHEIEESGMSDVALYREDWFYADFITGGRMSGSDVPTHWMPLPPPPADAMIKARKGESDAE